MAYLANQYKEEAKELLKDIKLPSGYYYEWAGQSEYLESNKDLFILC